MKMKKVILFVLSLIMITVLSGCTSNSQENNNQVNGAQDFNHASSDAKAVIYFFYGDGCPHCEVEKPFLEQMEQKYNDLEVRMYETWSNQENAKLFQDMAESYGIRAQGVPTTFIGDYEPIVGFADYMKIDLENKIKICVEQGCINPGSKL